MKKFWKRTEGFTLVELVVVIAILGILAGVGTVGYSGYVKKANQAADRQLVGYINQAYSIACVQNGVNAVDTKAGVMNIGANGKITAELNVTAPATPAELTGKIETSFGINYPEYKDVEFKEATKLLFNKGVFSPDFDGIPGIAQLKEYLAASSYSNVELTTLTGDVSALVGEMADFFTDPENRAMMVGGGFDTYLTNMGKNPSTMSAPELANAAVLYLSENAANMNSDSIAAATENFGLALFDAYLLDEGDRTPLTKELVDSWHVYTGSTLANYAMLYAAAEAIALENGGENGALYTNLKNADKGDQAKVLAATMAVFNAVDDESLENYINDQLSSDMEAYFNALQVVNTKESELIGGLSDSDLYTDSDAIKDLLEQMGG